LRLLNNSKTGDYVVDFGGGHGFLSLFLKKLGMKVIYCDHNHLSVNTINIIKKETGYGPDIIIKGSSTELAIYCKENDLLPKYLIATDLIEHVYNLNSLFADFYKLNPDLEMIFTTGSVKSNILKSRKLRKLMVEEETNLYYPVRKEFIKINFSALNISETEILAKSTRGLTFPYITQFVDMYLKTNMIPVLDIDKYNTCDPNTGNWTERILSKNQYRKIINNNHFQVTFENGYYNDERNSFVTSAIAKTANFFIKHFKLLSAFCVPFIILKVKKFYEHT
jgi:2-polyprenyl-3-methyl-5-hydroxy-6-metoxy-1,4-benzoquinol methylase